MSRMLCLVVGFLTSGVALGVAVMEGFENGVNMQITSPRTNGDLCLTLAEDGKNLILADTCSTENARQVWYATKEGWIGTSSRVSPQVFLSGYSDNAGAVQAHDLFDANAAQSRKFTFLQGGLVRNEGNQKCLAFGYLAPTTPPMQFLQYSECSAAQAVKLVAARLPFSATQSDPVIQPQAGIRPTAPVIERKPEIQPSAPVVSTPVVQAVPRVVPSAPEVVFGQGENSNEVVSRKDVASRGFISKDGAPQTGDHYLCICILSKEDDDCVNAVKAACMVGHIPSDVCNESFEQSNHDRISKYVVSLIEKGANCPSASEEQLRGGVQEQKLPVGNFATLSKVTAEDHYLCVCLSAEKGVDDGILDKRCEDAVRVACMVGHIPESDCFASFDKSNHGVVVQHVLRLIESGANCAQHLETKATETCPTPPCYHASKHSSKKEPHYLCVCLEDHNSAICTDAVKRACDAGSIPKKSCDVAIGAGHKPAVTKHIMHLIDHGAECAVGGTGTMTFTNHRCHCKQRWTAPNGEVMNFPDNCGDPGNSKGFSWCETYVEEQCVGEGESMSWDRCDNPQLPRYHLGEFAQTSVGKITPVDHYLCPCVVVDGTDELCQAAVKAACLVGHLSSEACAASFQNQAHAIISDEIVREISHGAKCVNGEVVAGPESKREKALRAGPTDADGVPLQTFDTVSGCGHGRASGKGCICEPNFAGLRCDYCKEGFVGYPTCVSKLDCDPVCQYGTCEFTTGRCTCPVHRTGAQCEKCAWGYSGPECVPDGTIYTTTHSKWFWVIVGLAGSYFFCCTTQGAALVAKLMSSKDAPLGNYSRLDQNADFFDGDASKELDLEHDAADFGAPAIPSRDSEKKKPATMPLSHSGLAI